jgi:hypothetical protein
MLTTWWLNLLLLLLQRQVWLVFVHAALPQGSQTAGLGRCQQRLQQGNDCPLLLLLYCL